MPFKGHSQLFNLLLTTTTTILDNNIITSLTQPAPSSVAKKKNPFMSLPCGHDNKRVRIRIYMDRLPKRTCNHFLKTIYITRNMRLQNFQRGGIPHLSQPATRSKKQPTTGTTTPRMAKGYAVSLNGSCTNNF